MFKCMDVVKSNNHIVKLPRCLLKVELVFTVERYQPELIMSVVSMKRFLEAVFIRTGTKWNLRWLHISTEMESTLSIFNRLFRESTMLMVSSEK